MGDKTDEELMSAYVAGDATAFRRLFERHAPLLLRVARAASMSEADGRDLVQQTFLQLHRARFDFHQGDRLRPWLFTIAHNLKRDHLRRRARWRLTELDMEAHAEEGARGAGELLEGARDAQRVRGALEQISPEQRQVISLHWFAGASFPEVAAALGVTVSTAKVRAHRGYNRLREILAKDEP